MKKVSATTVIAALDTEASILDRVANESLSRADTALLPEVKAEFERLARETELRSQGVRSAREIVFDLLADQV